MSRPQIKTKLFQPAPRHAIAGRARPSHATPHHILLIIRRAELACYRKGRAK